MQKGDRVSFQGRNGTVVGIMPKGMVDICFDDAQSRVERRSEDRLAPVMRQNPAPRGPRPSRLPRRNPQDEDNKVFAAVYHWLQNEDFRSAHGIYGSGSEHVRKFISKYPNEIPALLERYEAWWRQIEAKESKLHSHTAGKRKEVCEVCSSALTEDGWCPSCARVSLTPEEMKARKASLERSLQTMTPEQREQLTEKKAAERAPQIETRRKVGAELRRITKLPAGKREKEAVKSRYDLPGTVRSFGAGFWAREDAPRLGSDQQTMCGNPIDGTAYYLAVSTRSAPVSHWITKEEVIAGAPEGELEEEDLRAISEWAAQVGESEGQRAEAWGVYKPALEAGGWKINNVRLSVEGNRVKGRSRGKGRDASGRLEALDQEGKVVKLADQKPPPNAFFLEARPGQDKTSSDFRTYFIATKYIKSEVTQMQKYFLPFRPKFYRVQQTDDMTARAVVQRALAAKFADLPEDTIEKMALRLIFSGGVSAQGAPWSGKFPIINPDQLITAGRWGLPTLILGIEAKGDSPFFSWVLSRDPIPSEAEKEVSDLACEPSLQERNVKLRETESVLGAMRSAVDSARSTLQKWRDEPDEINPRDAEWRIRDTAMKLAVIGRWFGWLEESESELAYMQEQGLQPTPRMLIAQQIKHMLPESLLLYLENAVLKAGSIGLIVPKKGWSSALASTYENRQKKTAEQAYQEFLQAQVQKLQLDPAFNSLVKAIRGEHIGAFGTLKTIMDKALGQASLGRSLASLWAEESGSSKQPTETRLRLNLNLELAIAQFMRPFLENVAGKGDVSSPDHITKAEVDDIYAVYDRELKELADSPTLWSPQDKRRLGEALQVRVLLAELVDKAVRPIKEALRADTSSVTEEGQTYALMADLMVGPDSTYFRLAERKGAAEAGSAVLTILVLWSIYSKLGLARMRQAPRAWRKPGVKASQHGEEIRELQAEKAEIRTKLLRDEARKLPPNPDLVDRYNEIEQHLKSIVEKTRREEQTRPLQQGPTLDTLDQAISDLRATAGVKGMAAGSRGVWVYKTYNPLLFRMTQLFWPTRGQGSPVLGEQKKELAEYGTVQQLHRGWSLGKTIQSMPALDSVGRYGVALQAVLEATVKAQSEAEVSDDLQGRLEAGIACLTSGKAKGETGYNSVLSNYGRRFDLIRRLWPFADYVSAKDSVDAAFESVSDLIEDPLKSLTDLRQATQEVLIGSKVWEARATLSSRPPVLFPMADPASTKERPRPLMDFPSSATIIRMEQREEGSKDLYQSIQSDMKRLMRLSPTVLLAQREALTANTIVLLGTTFSVRPLGELTEAGGQFFLEARRGPTGQFDDVHEATWSMAPDEPLHGYELTRLETKGSVPPTEATPNPASKYRKMRAPRASRGSKR